MSARIRGGSGRRQLDGGRSKVYLIGQNLLFLFRNLKPVFWVVGFGLAGGRAGARVGSRWIGSPVLGGIAAAGLALIRAPCLSLARCSAVDRFMFILLPALVSTH